uniref:Rab3-GAP regulatory subunit N-terminal domain-containing protein n=1 Tax=Romanomermis culicivorax TaxID=13658 RepID=A0A915IXZ8_ROMCU
FNTLAIIPSRSSDPRPYEWSAIVIGLCNGQVFCYTDRGFLLTSLQYSEKPVIDIRIESGELTIVYEDCFVIINGLTLLASLKLQRQKTSDRLNIYSLSCPLHNIIHRKNIIYVLVNRYRHDIYEVARGIDIHQSLATGSADEEQIQWKKYTAENVRSPSTVVPTGVYKQTIWEQMVAASTRGGVNATIHCSGRAPYDTYCALGDCFSDNTQSSFVSFNW